MEASLPGPADVEYEFIRGPDRGYLEARLKHDLTEHCGTDTLMVIPWIGPWLCHKLRSICNESYIEEIPKKVPDRMPSTPQTIGYGMLTYSHLAVWRVVAMSALYCALGGAFMVFRWLKDWQDMQTALAPLAVLVPMWIFQFQMALGIIDRYDRRYED
jgi:hypothetical protein